jgi:hypothetical protein
MQKFTSKKYGLLLAFAVLGAAIFWLLTTDNVKIWPVRNTLQYHLLTNWWKLSGQPQSGAAETLHGAMQSKTGHPLA